VNEWDDATNPPKTPLLVSPRTLVFLSAASIGSQGFDWPRWRGPQGNGISRETGWNPQATPTVDGESVYVLSKDGILLCSNAQTGKFGWKRNLTADLDAMEPYYGFAGSPVIEENLVILTANISGLALNKSTGELAWKSRQVPIAYPTWTDRPMGTDYATPVVYSGNRKRYALISRIPLRDHSLQEMVIHLWRPSGPDRWICRRTAPHR
jgi:outer membrane protein assembly factor BamB